jgi:sterol desaturase/sphingolipid hydroxylase (fatty acid hydroxylase superfamily)
MCLLLHSVWPHCVQLNPLTLAERSLVLLNIILAILFVGTSLWLCEESIDSVKHISSVPLVEVFWIPVWILSEELLFFTGHRFLHMPAVYGLMHKVHHKFKVTNAWMAFYSHPVDNLFMMSTALLLPFLILQSGIRISAPVLALFFHVAVTPFIASHHATNDGAFTSNGASRVFETQHLLHHTKFNVNYGNFWFLDFVFGSAAIGKL